MSCKVRPAPAAQDNSPAAVAKAGPAAASGNPRSAAGNRVVLTGGACQLAGVRELAARVLGKQVRLGRPAVLRGLPDAAGGPAFATAAGLLSWAAGAGRTLHDIELEPGRPAGLFRRFVNFLRDRV